MITVNSCIGEGKVRDFSTKELVLDSAQRNVYYILNFNHY